MCARESNSSDLAKVEQFQVSFDVICFALVEWRLIFFKRKLLPRQFSLVLLCPFVQIRVRISQASTMTVSM